MQMKMKMKNGSHRYDIDTPISRHGQKYSKYKKVSEHNDAYIY